jgi:hypothetical protein
MVKKYGFQALVTRVARFLLLCAIPTQVAHAMLSILKYWFPLRLLALKISDQ